VFRVYTIFLFFVKVKLWKTVALEGHTLLDVQ